MMNPTMSFAEYLAIDSVSNSRLTDLARSPAHCYALHIDPNRPPREPRPWMLTGSLAHCAILEPDAVEKRYAVVPEDAPKRPSPAQWAAKDPNEGSRAAMAWWKDFNTRTSGLEIVSAAQFATVLGQVEAVRRVPVLAELLADGTPEVSIFWTDEATGLECRARADWLGGPDRAPDSPRRWHSRPLDIKTIADLTPDKVSKAVASLGYHRKAAFYRRGLRANGFVVDEFVFGFVSGTYPYLAAPFLLDDETMQQGDDEVDELLELYAQCKRSGVWPGFGESYQLVGLPAWAKRSSDIEVGYAS